MAGIRSRYEFTSRYGVDWKIDIYDANFVGSLHTFSQGDGLVIDYESERNDTIFNEFIFSKAEVKVAVTDSSDLTEIEYLLDNQSEDFVMEVYKDNVIYWRGVLMQDLITLPNVSQPYFVTLAASDGLRGLEKINDTANYGLTTTIAKGLHGIFSVIPVADALGSSDTLMKTANRWYETLMPATGTGVDPLIYARLEGAALAFLEDTIDGVSEYVNTLEILRAVLKTFKLRCLMVDGAYHCIQTDQYAEGLLYLHSYPKNYPTGSATVGNYDPDIVPTVQGNGSFSFAPEIGRAKAFQDTRKGGLALGYLQRNDWDTARTLASVVNYTANTQMELEFVTGPTAVWEYTGAVSNIFLRSLKADFEIKVVLASTYYLTNKNGALEWTTTSTDKVTLRVNNVSVLTRSTVIVVADCSPQTGTMTLPILPTGGTMTLEIDATLIDGAGNPYTTSLTLGEMNAGVKLRYVDPSLVDGEVRYQADNTGSESTFIYDDNELLIGDFQSANYGTALSIFNGSTWGYTGSWKRLNVGTAYSIINLGLRQVVEWQDKQLEILNGRIISTTLKPISRLDIYSNKYILNRVRIDANLDEWDGSWIEMQSTNSGPTINLDDPTERAGNWSLSGKFSRPNNRYFDLLENSVFRITNTDSEVSGTVTSIGVDAPGYDIANNGEVFLIVHPVTGESDELELNGEILTASTSLPVVSVTLSRTYPVGSYIYMPIGQVLGRIYALENR